MKTRLEKKFIGILLFAFVLIVSISWFSWCGDCIKKQDMEMIEKINAHLKEIGDRIKVSEIYPGDWKEVCAYGEGFDDHILSPFLKEGDEYKILNDAHEYITDRYNESALIFNYGENKFEIYRSVSQYLTYAVYKQGLCFEKGDAYFYLRVNNPNNKTIMVVSENDNGRG